MANPITNKVKSGKIPVIKKELDKGVIAEANNDGTIYLDKDVKDNSPLAKEAVQHEMVHIDQMARGDLNYDKDKVFWKGKEYSRDDMQEGSKSLPWEKEAYNKTKHMTKKTKESDVSPLKIYDIGDTELTISAGVHGTKLMRDAMKRKAMGEAAGSIAGQLDPFAKKADEKRRERKENEGGEGSGITMKSTPITMKAKSPVKVVGAVVAAAAPALIKGAASAIGKKAGESAMKMKRQTPLKVEEEEEEGSNTTTAIESSKGNLQDDDGTSTSGTFTDTTKTTTGEGGDLPSYDEAWEKDLEGIRTGGGYKNKQEYVNDMEGIKPGDDRDKEREQAREEAKKPSINVDTTSVFEKDTQENTETEPGKYNMGYQESMDAKWGEGVRRRDKKQDMRQSTKDKQKYDRNYRKAFNEDGSRKTGRGADRAYNRIGDMSKEDYVGARTPEQANYYQPVGTIGEGTETKTISDVEGDPNQKTYKLVDGKKVEVTSPNNMNSNKTKAPFKLKGWGGYNN